MPGFVAALFTRMSIRPNSFLTASTILRISSTSLMWAETARARRPLARISSATISRSGSLRLTTATSAPASARARAMALPIPRLPPVTRATFPSRAK
jgi:hypothetical protein